MSDFEASWGGGRLQGGGARGRGFRGVTCGNVGGFHRTCFDAPSRASLHGPLLSLNGSVAGSPVGLRPQYRPLSQGSFVFLASSGFERPFDQYFRTAFSCACGPRRASNSGLRGGLFGPPGGSWALLGGPWAPRSIFEGFWVPGPEIVKNELRFTAKFGQFF